MNIKKLFNRKPRCRHTRKDGGPCQSPPQAGKDVCYAHDPDRAEQRLEARRRAGSAPVYEPVIPPGFDPGPLETYAQIGAFIDRIGLHISKGEMDLRTARKYLDRANTILHKKRRERRRQRLADKAERQERKRLKAEVDELFAKGRLWMARPPKTSYIN